MNKNIKVESTINHIDFLVDSIIIGNNNIGYDLFNKNGKILKGKRKKKVNTKYSNKCLVGIVSIKENKLSIELYGQSFFSYSWAKTGLVVVPKQKKLNENSQFVILDENTFEKLRSIGAIENYDDLGVEN